MQHRIIADFLNQPNLAQSDWVDHFNELERWLDTYTPGWSYVEVNNTYCIDFVKESDLTMYLLRWAN